MKASDLSVHLENSIFSNFRDSFSRKPGNPLIMNVNSKKTRWLIAVLLAGLASGCENNELAPVAIADSGSISACSDISTPNATQINVSDIRAEEIATGLEVPWDLEVLNDGRILVTERKGQIRLIHPETGLRQEPWATIPVVAKGVVGLMGIALSPEFSVSGHVYVVGTYDTVGQSSIDSLLHKIKKSIIAPFQPDIQFPLRNRVYRLTDDHDYGRDQTTMIDNLPSHEWYGTSSLAFGPDSMMYITTGDAAIPNLAQNDSSLAGKLLRYREDGGIPNDNPVSGSPVYAKGFRNSQGLDWDTKGNFFATEHGPVGYDELNLLINGGNYGWPNFIGPNKSADYNDPILTWFAGIAPSGLAVFDRPGHPWHGDLLIASLKTKQLRRVATYQDAGGNNRICEEILLSGTYGRLRAVHMGSDGHVYLTTSNRDQRGQPEPADDRVLRLHIP